MKRFKDLREVFTRAQMKKAIDIARKSTGNYDKAYAEIEKIKKGLGDEHIIKNALKKANESVELEEVKKGETFSKKEYGSKFNQLREARDYDKIAKDINKTYASSRGKVGKDKDGVDTHGIRVVYEKDGYRVQQLTEDGLGDTFVVIKNYKQLLLGWSAKVGGNKKTALKLKKTDKFKWTWAKYAKKYAGQAGGMLQTPGSETLSGNTWEVSPVELIAWLKKEGIKESVELDEVKKGETFTKAQAKAYFKKQYGSKFNAKKMGTETDDKGNKYWMDKGHSGEAVPMKEEVELEEDTKKDVAALNKKLSLLLKLLKADVKRGNDNDIITRLESISIFIDSSISKIKKNMSEDVELDEGFNLPAMNYNNLPKYKDFQNTKIKDAMKEFSISKPDTKTVQDLILWLNTFSMMWKAKHIK